MIDLGDLYPLSVTITTADGEPENATEVTLYITLPDGSMVTVGPVAPAEPGVYSYSYPTVQAGLHRARWVATGLNASVFTDTFIVDPPDGGDFVSLADAIGHLRKKGDTPDAEKLRVFVGAACQMITDRMGDVSPRTVVADRRPVRGMVVLPSRPVISIVSVQQLPGLAAVPQADAAAEVRGWTLESPEGVVSVSGHSGLLRFTYRAGRSPLPANFRLAGLDLIADLWRNSQLNTGGGRPGVGSDELVVPGVTYALPYRVRQLLGLDKRPRDEPLVG